MNGMIGPKPLLSGASALSEGTSFAFAVYPSDGNVYDTELSIATRVATEVNITFPTVTYWVDMAADSTYTTFVPQDYRVTDGLETKGVYVTSEKGVTVHMASTWYGARCTPDATLVRPIGDNDTLHFVASLDRSFYEYRPWSFYMIVARERDTQVEVFTKENGVFVLDVSETLQEHQVFTRDARGQPGGSEIDYTGAYIVSSKPVAVYSGNQHVVLTKSVSPAC